MDRFSLKTEFRPKGDQPEAIRELVDGLGRGVKDQVLLGVTGSGKTFTMANVIAQVNRPAIVIAPNKTLAAQLYSEFKGLFPENAVEYFVSYYDYYQPEAYIPGSDTYIEKDSSINETIDKMRHSATRSLLEGRDVIIVASVSCIYGIGSPDSYRRMLVMVEDGETLERDALLSRLVDVQYSRNDADFHRGVFRVRGDVVEVFPTYEEDRAIRIEFFGDVVDGISEIDPLRGRSLRKLDRVTIMPASHYVTPRDTLEETIESVERELVERIAQFNADGKPLEAERIEQRTRFDLEMLREMGFCTGIENYSRYLSGRVEGEPPYTLIDFFPDDYLVFIDESHITIPQLRGMFRGDRSRKENLVNYGFRLSSALDNRPLCFEEFEERTGQVIYVSATPGDYELEKSVGVVVQQVIRPTGLIDPRVEVRPADRQVDDLLGEIRKRVEAGNRVLVTTLTKRMAEDLTDYYRDIGVRVNYLHSDVKTIERVDIIRDLRLGKFDVLVGINLLREGLDLPEVSLVAILDADKEGFLRSARSLIQTFGRTARNVEGTVILYADRTTNSMSSAIAETDRRREIQKAYNRKHGITPETIKTSILDIRNSITESDYVTIPIVAEEEERYGSLEEIAAEVEVLEARMWKSAEDLDFEEAAVLRERIKKLRELDLKLRG